MPVGEGLVGHRTRSSCAAYVLHLVVDRVKERNQLYILIAHGDLAARPSLVSTILLNARWLIARLRRSGPRELGALHGPAPIGPGLVILVLKLYSATLREAEIGDLVALHIAALPAGKELYNLLILIREVGHHLLILERYFTTSALTPTHKLLARILECTLLELGRRTVLNGLVLHCTSTALRYKFHLVLDGFRGGLHQHIGTRHSELIPRNRSLATSWGLLLEPHELPELVALGQRGGYFNRSTLYSCARHADAHVLALLLRYLVSILKGPPVPLALRILLGPVLSERGAKRSLLERLPILIHGYQVVGLGGQSLEFNALNAREVWRCSGRPQEHKALIVGDAPLQAPEFGQRKLL